MHPKEIYISSLDFMHKGVNCVSGRDLSVRVQSLACLPHLVRSINVLIF